MRRFILSGGLILLGLLSLWSGSCRDRGVPPGAKAELGEPAPVFHLQDLAGRRWRLADLQGQVVLLYFWAPRCPICRQELVHLEEIHRQLAAEGEGFQLLTLVVSQELEQAGRLARQLDLTFPILRDPGGENAERYGVTVVPTTFLIDRDGVLREGFMGHQHWDVDKMGKVIHPYRS